MARTTLLGGARINISGESQSLERAMRRASDTFNRQERELKRLRAQAARTNRTWGFLVKNLKAVVGIGTAVALAGMAKSGAAAARTTADWGANLAEVAARLGTIPSHLYAIRAAFEDDGVAISTTDQNLTALSRRFAANAPKLREHAEKIGISWAEWRATGGDLAKLIPVIATAMAGAASQADKLAFLQEAGSTSARKWATALQRADFNTLVDGYQRQNKVLDDTSKRLKDLSQIYTDIDRDKQLVLADTVAKNAEAYASWNRLLAELESRAVEAAAGIGLLHAEMEKVLEQARKDAARSNNVQALARGGHIDAALKAQGRKTLSSLLSNYERLSDLVTHLGEQATSTQIARLEMLEQRIARINASAGPMFQGPPPTTTLPHVDVEPVVPAAAPVPLPEPLNIEETISLIHQLEEGWVEYYRIVNKQAEDSADHRQTLEKGMLDYQQQVWAAIQKREEEADSMRFAAAQARHDAAVAQRIETERAAQAEVFRQAEAVRDAQVEAAKDAQAAWERAALGMTQAFGNAFASFIAGTKSAKDAFRSFAEGVIQQLFRIAEQAVAAKLFGFLTGLFTSGAFGGTGASVIRGGIPTYGVPGGRAGGGPVAAGRAYIVGERGPEVLRMGSQGGRVIPNHALAGMGGSPLTINVYAKGNKAEIREGVMEALPAIMAARDTQEQRRGRYPNAWRDNMRRSVGLG